ncbi:non-ribosomal peptide synthetase [Nocardia sienata]|uniref:non-ribosomal peptide synthetase n=1 Tax=Nocardia sienata TaxID=248552 RepID=UPI0007A3C68A|nr:non-ribosomal peptide synthetase [Nocardia sienata]
MTETTAPTFLELFDTHVRRSPTATAVVGKDATATYAELAAAGRAWAAELSDRGVQPQDVVAVCLPRSVDAVAAAIGVFAVGATVLMLETNLPPARRSQLVDEAGGAYIVDAPLDPARSPDTAEFRRPQPHDAAYIVFTSGSTGVPKGVVVEHGSLANTIAAQHALLDIEPGDRVALIAPFTVDAFLFELTLALCAGATVHIADEAQRHPGLPLRRFLRTNQITALVATPTTLRSLDPADHRSVRLLLSAGEALDTELAGQWAPGRVLINAYGPTEAAIWATAARISGTETEIGLGEPIPGVRVDVLRDDLTATEVDEPGEIWLSGAGIARGYLNVDSAHGFVETQWGRAYRTGDRAVRRADGTLVFLGRDDDQVKLGGLRVELGEIRAQMLRHPAVADAAVRVHKDRLVTYVTGPDATALNRDDLMLFMEEQLPMQLAPTTYVVVPRIPTTAWGKVDMTALPDPDELLRRPEAPAAEPATDLQRYLIALAEELIGATEVTVADDLFVLGLNSIRVARFIDRINQDRGVELAPVDIFQHPTIAALADRIAADTVAEATL